MSHFSMPVSLYMAAPVATVLGTDPLERVQETLALRNISAVAVVSDSGSLAGVVTRTDLLRVGRRQSGARRSAPVMALPAQTASDVMQRDVLTVHPEERMSVAAAAMVKNHVHRLFVASGGKAIGVLSTRDVMQAVCDQRVSDPLAQYMSSPVFTVSYDDPVSLAVERFEKAHVSGLIVVEDDWPIGVFTQVEALESKDVARDTPVEQVLSPAMLCLDVDTPMHRAAAQAASMDVRRVIAVHDRRVRGILTGIDFARAASC